MFSSARFRSVLLAALTLASVALAAPDDALAQAASGRRPITETDIFAFNWIADPQISPDGSSIVFVKVTVNEKKDGYDTALWVVATSGGAGERRLTSGPRDQSPRWSPDGSRIAFLRTVDTAGRPQSQIHLLPMRGGEATALSSLPRGASSLAWSPDGRKIAFTSTTRPDDLTKPDGAKPRVSDVRVISRAAYRANGGGYLDPERRASIWVIDAPDTFTTAPTPNRLTTGEFDETNPEWASDGSRIFFTSTRVAEPYYELPDRDAYAVAVAGGAAVRVASIDGTVGSPVVSPDGRRLAFVGSVNGRPARSYNQPDLFVADVGGNADAVRNLTAKYDFDMGGGLAGDQRAPRGGQPAEPVWSRDGQTIITGAGVEGRSNLVRVDAASGAVTPLTKGDQEIVAFSATRDAAKLALLISTPTNIGDLFVFDVATGASTQLTKVNEALFSQLSLTPPIDVWYQSFDGRRVHTLVQRPPDFDPSRKYPLILNIHGGPHAAYGHTFVHEFQWMAAKGYIVVYPNPRGSTSYGQDFGNVIQYHYPGDDAKDLLAAVDEVIKTGAVDTSHLGVTGGSGGGVLTNWIVTQTDRFAAAVSQRSISDWSAFWYTADFTLFQPTWFRAAPWENSKDFTERSAITFADRIKTPMMFIEGEIDFRTPPTAGGEQLFRALKYRKIPTVMVQFPGESHELSRSGQPWHRVERLQHIVGWFDKYLQGKENTSYEPQ